MSNNLQTMMYQPKANPQELMDRLLKAAGSSSDSNNLMYKSDGNGVCLETLFTQLQSLASQSMYFGRSLQRIGCDFRPHLANLFSNQIELFIQSYIDNIVSEFKSALMNWVWKIPSDSVQVNGSYTERNDSVLSSYSKMINSLLEYPPLILLYNGYVELFRGLNIYCPSALKSRIIIIISNGLHSSALCITQSYDNLKEQHSDDWIDDATCLASAFSTSLTHCILANVIDYLLIEDVDANASLPICSNPTSLYRPILLNLSRMICSPIYLKWSSLLPSLATTTTTTTTTATVQPIVNTNNIDLQVDVHSSTVEDCVNTMTTDLNMLKLSASKPPSVNDSDNYVGSDTVNGVS
ncbi:unnamed protein product [Trichobilharzia regenti]|nr:unnamed protein product [Trichobilharzia regenti]